MISNKYKNEANSERSNLLLTNNNSTKDKTRRNNNESSLSKEKKNINNLLNIFNNNRVRRKNKDISNDELIDNSKNCTSYSINNYNNNMEKRNINRINKNENKLIKSISGNFKNNDNNNQNKPSNLINLYKDNKNKYSYILNKKSSRDKTRKLNHIIKSQSCTKIESYSNKNNNKNTITFDTKVKYEKGLKNIISNNIINLENILSDSSRNKITPLKEDKSNLNLIQKNDKAILQKLNIQNQLTLKQKAYFLLCTSPILRLNEQIILSNIDPIIKSNLSIPTILNNHEIILENKINELKEKINLCVKKLNTPFVASKISDVTLNFITSLDEQEFKDFDLLTKNKEELSLFYNLIKILSLLINEKFDKNNDNRTIKNELFNKINEKGFKSLKDYLYFIYIKNNKEINEVKYIEEINEITKIEPNIIDKKYFFRMCRFIAFSIYLIREIINYGNSIKDTIELKIRNKEFLDIVIEKLNKVKRRNNINIKVIKK